MRCVGFTIALISLAAPAFAVFPRFVPDSELAVKPIIVVAKWKGDRLGRHQIAGTDPIGGQRITRTEQTTTIIVERVIHGNIRPGEYRTLITDSTSWDEKGKNIGFTTWNTPLEVDSVRHSNL